MKVSSLRVWFIVERTFEQPLTKLRKMDDIQIATNFMVVWLQLNGLIHSIYWAIITWDQKIPMEFVKQYEAIVLEIQIARVKSITTARSLASQQQSYFTTACTCMCCVFKVRFWEGRETESPCLEWNFPWRRNATCGMYDSTLEKNYV